MKARSGEGLTEVVSREQREDSLKRCGDGRLIQPRDAVPALREQAPHGDVFLNRLQGVRRRYRPRDIGRDGPRVGTEELGSEVVPFTGGRTG